MKKILLVVSFFLCTYFSFSQPYQHADSSWSWKFAKAMTTRFTPTIDAMTGKGWEYSNSIILHGMELIYEQAPTASFLSYIQAYVDTYVNTSGVVSGLTTQTLDKIHPGILCLWLWEKTGVTKYKTAATNIRNYIITTGGGYPKTPNGGYWHKPATPYDDVMMLDGIYMAHPFLVKYGVLFSDATAVNTGVDQLLLLDGIVHNYTTHTVKHAWHYDKTKAWADPVTGVSSQEWSRAAGWYVMAVVDILKYLPTSHAKYAQVKAILTDLAIGIKNYQQANGLWYQVVDQPGVGANYYETSGSAMFVYAIKSAINMGLLLDATYGTVATKGWTGLKTKIGYAADGKPGINQFAPAMSVQNDFNSYVAIAPVNTPGSAHPHGYAAIMMAGSVMEFPLSGTLPVKFTDVSGIRSGSDVLLRWQNHDYQEVADYVVERSFNGVDYNIVGHVKPQSVANSWTDVNAVAPVIYYRVKALSLNNAIDYSEVVKVSMKGMPLAITASPNPVKNGVLNVVAQGLRTGSYHMAITNSSGQTIFEEDLYVAQEKLTEVVKLPSTAKGLHYVQLKGISATLNTTVLVY
jgi:unsaturated rhamnogalacturonyl hydrolase